MASINCSNSLQRLLDSLEEVCRAGLVPVCLVSRVVQEYDRTVARILSQAEEEFSFTADLAAYRSVDSKEKIHHLSHFAYSLGFCVAYIGSCLKM